MRNPAYRMVAVLLVLGLLGVTMGGCMRNNQVHAAQELDSQLMDAVMDFGLDLHRQVTLSNPGENIFLSPASVSMALHMTLNGARGSTREAMAQTLNLQDMTLDELNQANSELLTLFTATIPGVDISMANSLWARQGVAFNDGFLKANQDYYRARVEELDFDRPDAPSIINTWVKEETKGLIEEIIEEIEDDAVLFLINALYFKGSWSHPFDQELTRDAEFHSLDGVVTVPMMQMSRELDYLQEQDIQVVRLPYGEGRMSMYVILPQEGYSLEAFVAEITPDRWTAIVDGLSQVQLDLFLPRFGVEFKTELSNDLKALGMDIAFDARQADFGNMRPIPPNLFIGGVNHRTVVEVNEEGTEAAAVTSVEIKVESAAPEPVIMKVDRPFFFAIRDDLTGMMLFTGSVISP